MSQQTAAALRGGAPHATRVIYLEAFSKGGGSMAKVSAIPEGLHTVVPSLVLSNCSEALAFFAKALGAVETSRAPDPSGKKIWHASFKIGDSTFYCNDEFPEMGARARPASFWIYGEAIDARFKRAVEAGAKATPLKRVIEPDDVSSAILACITHLKASTGSRIVVDGGRHL